MNNNSHGKWFNPVISLSLTESVSVLPVTQEWGLFQSVQSYAGWKNCKILKKIYNAFNIKYNLGSPVMFVVNAFRYPPSFSISHFFAHSPSLFLSLLFVSFSCYSLFLTYFISLSFFISLLFYSSFYLFSSCISHLYLSESLSFPLSLPLSLSYSIFLKSSAPKSFISCPDPHLHIPVHLIFPLSLPKHFLVKLNRKLIDS